MGGQLVTQIVGILATVAWSAAATAAIVAVTRALVGLRADDEAITEGLDLAAHGERGYSL
jgi:Amt family ammonium transporter